MGNERSWRGARAIPFSLRLPVLERDGKCVLCGRGSGKGATFHVDHITPFSLGGLNILDNLQAFCEACNLGKGYRSDRSFLRW